MPEHIFTVPLRGVLFCRALVWDGLGFTVLLFVWLSATAGMSETKRSTGATRYFMVAIPS
jgi:hypothetical protein